VNALLPAAVGVLGRLIFCGAESIDWQIRGKGFDDDPRLGALRRAAGELARDALARQAADLGLKLGRAPIVWVLDASPARESPAGGEPFELGRTAFEGSAIVVTLPARKYLRSPERAAPVLRHECAHALLASTLGSKERYESIPRWLREGLALHGSREGDHAMRDAIALAAFGGKPAASFLVGIVSPDISHAESYAAVTALTAKLGPDGVRALLHRFIESRDLDSKRAMKLIEEAIGQPIDAFAIFALREARLSVSRLLPDEREAAFREALGLDARGEKEESTRKLAALLPADPEGPLACTIHYLLARRLIEGAKGDAGGKSRAHLDAVLARDGDLWRPEALVLLGERLEADGKTAAARDAWLEVLEVFGEDAAPASRARESLRKTGVVK
jgi:hypothetical protein